jgi:PAS domain S-box-containing protein
MWETDKNNLYSYINPQVINILGYKPEELIGKSPFDYMPEAEAERVKKQFAVIQAAGKPIVMLENINIHKDGHWVYLETSAVPITDKKGINIGYRGIDRDITKRRRFESALHEQEVNYQIIAEKTGQILYDYNLETGIIKCQGAIEEMTGYSKEEGAQIDINLWKEILHPDDKEAAIQTFEKARATCSNYDMSYRFKRKDGDYIHVEEHGIFLSNDQKKAYRMLGTIINTTMQQRALEELEKTQALFQAALLQSPSGIVIADVPNGKIRFVNSAALAIRGKTDTQLTDIEINDYTKNWAFFYSDGITPFPQDELPLSKAITEGRTSKNVELVIRHSSGKNHWTLVNAAPIKDKNGQIISAIVVFEDITERKQTLEALKTQNRNYSTLLKNLNGMVYHCANDPSWTMEFISQGCYELTGYKPEEILHNKKRSFQDIIHPAHRNFVWDHWQKNLKEHKALEIEYQIITASGKTKWVWEKGRGIYDDDGKLLHLEGFITDITERKLAEEEVFKLRNYLSNIINSMPSLLVGVDADSKVTLWNKTAERNTGISPNDAQGKLLSDILPELTPLEQDTVNESIKKRETKQLLKKPIKSPQSTSYKDITIFPLAADSVEGAVIRIDDITDKVQLEEKLHLSQKMDAIGKLAGGVAHDFNNMLAGIIGTAELLKSPSRNLDAHSIKLLDIIIRASERAADLTAKLLAFGRKGKFASEPVDLHNIIDDTVAILDKTIDKRISIKVVKDAENAIIKGDSSSLQNAIMNIAINASHAMPDGGNINIHTESVLLDKAYCETSSFELKSGDFIKISIKDTGCGIPADQLPKIFEPFYTTKEQGKGTGLGLAAVYGTIQDHHGAISVHSEPFIETIFEIYLPILHIHTQEETNGTTIETGTGQVLLVDDEDIIRTTGKLILENMGYKVMLAANGAEAIEKFKNCHDNIDITIVDMIMPVMNGRETFLKMREIDQNCKIIISSGYTKDESLDELLGAGLAGFIKKPYRGWELSQVLKNTLKG